ncbi:hypothetical protein N692_04770 [Lactiplantibacillus plantarum EGD-AQ4]|nr:hypothetical protein N692_04770 [Lactiplantibacillus plantarum EGD-AQ4]
MKGSLLIGGSLMSLLVLAGCGQQVSQSKTTTKTSQSVTKTAKPKTATDRLLVKLATRIPADGGKDNAKPKNYSKFYQLNGHWYWRLSNRKQQKLSGGRVQSFKYQKDQSVYQLTIDDNGTKHQLKLSWVDSGKYAYHLSDNSSNLDNDYILSDGTSQAKWRSGAPAKLIGKWRSPFQRADPYMKEYPYMRTDFTITKQDMNGVNNIYDAQKANEVPGSAWAINDHLSSKKLSDETYMLKSYVGDGLNLNKVHLADGRLTIFYQTSGAIKNMQLVKDTDSTDSSSTADTADSSSDTTDDSGDTTTDSNEKTSSVDQHNLTTQQVNDWVWTEFKKSHVNNSDFTQEDYDFQSRMEDDGLLYISVLENHSTANMKAAGAASGVSPRDAQYRIDEHGHLQETSLVEDNYHTVSTHYSGE